ncbi:hypothetical protein BGX38DRAFT_1281859 [Terfezia claveryi]|nr:hypothetical protein BGX38DRAFT_1281859 [Terfezia claveryi]
MLSKRKKELLAEAAEKFMIFQQKDQFNKSVQIDFQLSSTSKAVWPYLTYNLCKGVPWLALNWPFLTQYMLMGNLYDLETPEIVPPITKPIETHEEIGRKLFGARGKGKGKSMQYEEEDDGDYETDIEEISEKDMPLPPKDRKKPKHTKKSKTPDKKPRKSSSGVAGGRSEDPGSGSEGDKSDNGSGDDSRKRSTREPSPHHLEWSKKTGQKIPIQQVSKSLVKKANKHAKIPNPLMIDGVSEKWRNQTTFDNYVQLLQKWVEY